MKNNPNSQESNNIYNSNDQSENLSQHNNTSQTEQIRIDNEIEALSCIYIDTIDKIKYDPNGLHEMIIHIKPNQFNSTFFDPICWIKLKIKYNRGYPSIPPGIDICEKYNLSPNELKEINQNIDNIANIRSDQNCEMLNDIIEYVKKFLDDKSKAYSPFKRKENEIHNENAIFLRTRKLSTDKSEEKNSIRKNMKKLNYFMKDNDLLGHNYTYNSSKIDYENVDSNFNMNSKIMTSNGKSRMLTDFQIIKKIGEGGGGSVYKVRNNFDGMYYAIKKIKLCLTKKNKLNTKYISREVSLLSRLQHPNVVRYYQAWIEDYDLFPAEPSEEDQEESFDVTDLEDESLSQSDNDEESKNSDMKDLQQSKNNKIEDFTITRSKQISLSEPASTIPKQKYLNFNTNSDMSNTNEEKYDDSLINFQENDNKDKKNKIWEIEDDEEYKIKLKQEKLKKTKNLFIQMEFCEGKTLREAIDYDLLVSPDEDKDKIKLKLINQILDVFVYIHSKNLIHRDIKPANIFLDKEFNIKIGDFGLATIKKTKNEIDNLTKSHKKEFLLNCGELFSCGIGTKYYMSPEQESNTKYDEKTDMYSLGITIFEMFYPFKTKMERDHVMKIIKENHLFPNNFKNYASNNIIQIIKSLTEFDTVKRPSSYDLLNSNLIPLNFSEKKVIDNFAKIIEDNNILKTKFLKIILDKNIREISKKSKDHFENNKDINMIFLNNKHKDDKINLNFTHFILNIYDSIRKKIEKILNANSSIFVRIPEIEIFSDIKKFYDINKEKIISINETFLNADYIKLELYMSQSGEIIRPTKNIYEYLFSWLNNLKSKENNFVNVNKNELSHNPNILPISLHTYSKEFENHSNNKILERNFLSYVNIWTDKINDVVLNDDIYYEINSFKLAIMSIAKLELTNNIVIVINSSFILDNIFFKQNVDDNVKYRVLYLIMNLRKKNEFKNLSVSEIFIRNYQLFEIDKDKLQKLSLLLDVSGEIENIKKKFDKKSNLYNHLEIINDFIVGISNLENCKKISDLKNKIKVDFSLIPNNLEFYNGVFFKIKYYEIPKDHKDEYVLCTGGRIDNHLNFNKNKVNETDVLKNPNIQKLNNYNEISELDSDISYSLAKNKGFSINFYIDNFILIFLKKVKEKDPFYNFNDIVICTTEKIELNKHKLSTDLSGEELEKRYKIKDCMDNIKSQADMNNLKNIIIYNTQLTTDFLKFFSIFRMHLLVIVKFDKNNSDILIECKQIDKNKTFKKEEFDLKHNINNIRDKLKRKQI